MIGLKNGTCGEFSKSIHTVFVDRGVCFSASTVFITEVRLFKMFCSCLRDRTFPTFPHQALARAWASHVFGNFLDDSNLLVEGKLREHRQGEDFRRHSFGNRKVTLLKTESPIGILQVKRNGIMDPGSDACIGQIVFEFLSVTGSYYKQVVDRPRAGWLVWHNHAIYLRRKQITIARGIGAPLFIPLAQMRELGPENPGLDGIQPPVVTLYFVVVLLELAVISQHAYALGQPLIVSGYGSSLSAGPEILPRIKTERGRMAYRSGFHPAILLPGEVLGSMCLASILDHAEVVFPGQFHNRVHVGHLPIEVNWNHRLNDFAATAVDESSALRIWLAFPLQIALQPGRIHVVSALVDINEVR